MREADTMTDPFDGRNVDFAGMTPTATDWLADVKASLERHDCPYCAQPVAGRCPTTSVAWRLVAEVARLREAIQKVLARYARHDDDCDVWGPGCRCGYAAAKAALEGKR